MADDPIEVGSRWLDPPPYFVGQVIGIEVTVRGFREEGSIVPSRVDGGSLAAGPVATSPEGEQVATFWLTANQAGPIRVPPFFAREAGTDRVGRGGALSSQVRELPSLGRTRAFLGGVGTLESVEAEAVPSEVRVGDSFEYRLRIVGKAAAGSSGLPDFSGWERSPLGLRVDRPRSEMIGESERVITARVRATVAGESELPAVAVAAFDPKPQVYRTWRGPRVPVRVAAAPTFDPARVAYGPPPVAPVPRRFPWPSIGLGFFFWVVVVGLGRSRIRAWRDPRRLARRVVRSLVGLEDPSVLAERVESGLIAYLKRAEGRPAGALTPREAGDWVGGRLPEWGEPARRVIELADQARYSGRRTDCEPLRGAAIALFRALAARHSGRSHGDRRQV